MLRELNIRNCIKKKKLKCFVSCLYNLLGTYFNSQIRTLGENPPDLKYDRGDKNRCLAVRSGTWWSGFIKKDDSGEDVSGCVHTAKLVFIYLMCY